MARTECVLVVGGADDPNLHALSDALVRRGAAHDLVLVGADSHPWIEWDLQRDTLILDGRPLDPTAAFVRHDVFTHLADGRAASANRAFAWHQSLSGWVLAHPSVRTFNRKNPGAANKPHTLVLARECGLEIPRTIVTNARDRALAACEGGPGIAKPVAGGGLCRPLEQALAAADARNEKVLASPAIVQAQLVAPELRVYVIGSCVLGFVVESAHLDYREVHDARVLPTTIDPELSNRLLALTQRMGLDFAAADFKTSADDGRPRFLEINTGPMFAAFDRAAGGGLTDAMIDVLCGRAT